jgi:Cu/Ag efflux protein CusF
MVGWFDRGAALAALIASIAAAEAAISPDLGLSAGPAPNVWRAQAVTGVFHGVGVVTAIDATSGALTLDHDEIRGLMAAMEMMYRVKSRDISEGLGVGDRIAFDVDGTYTIVGVKRLSRGGGAPP